MHVVLVNGWSARSDLWNAFFALFPDGCQFDVIDLDDVLTADQWSSRIDSYLRDGSVLIGWSLGGELALHCATKTAKKLRALVLLQTNLCFVERDDWPDAMPLALFEQFSGLVDSGDEKQIKRQFAHMMVEGSEAMKQDRRQLKTYYESDSIISHKALLSGMMLLRNLDLRENVTQLSCPVLSILGEKDSLVPVSCSSELNARVIPGMGHLPCFSYAEPVYQEIQVFLSGLG